MNAMIGEKVTAMPICTIYLRGSDVYVVGSAKNVFGIFQDSEPFIKLSQPVSSVELGNKVLLALESYREKVPGKTFVRGQKPPPDPFLVFSGFKSWGIFEKGAQHFTISSNGSEIEIIPSIPAPKGGYLHQPDKTIRCRAEAAEIGDLLLGQTLKG